MPAQKCCVLPHSSGAGFQSVTRVLCRTPGDGLFIAFAESSICDSCKKINSEFDRMKALHQGAAYGTMAKKAGKGERI